MKKINLIKGLWNDSHEKQTPQTFGRYAAMLIMLLTLGVGQMWAGQGYNGESHVYLNVDGTTKYYKVSTESWSTGSSLPGTWGGVLKDQTFNKVLNIQIKGGAVGGWTENGGNISGNLYYKVTNNTTTPSSGWTTVGGINANYTTKSGNNCFRYKNDYSVNVTPTTPGTYYLHIKITDGDSNNRTSYVKIVVPSFTVAGSSAVLGSDWSATDTGNDMTFSSGTSYTLTKSNVTLSTGTTYECKVVLNHDWDAGSYPGSNKTFTVAANGHYNVTFTFNASTKAVDVSTTRLYAVIYNDNGKTSGSVPATSYHANGATVTVASNSGSLAKTGYSFGGWNTNSSGTGTNYTAGSGTFTMGSSDKNLYAKWTENKSTVTLVASPEGKGTFQVGGETVTSTQAGVTTTPSVTAYPISGYRFTGWSITGGASISSTSDNPTTVTGGGAGTAATLTATFEENLVYYDVTFGVGTSYTSLGSISATNNTTSSAISSGDDILSASNITFTATPNTGYVVEGWYTDAACTAGKHDAGSTTYTIASLSSDVTVYVKFVEKTWSVAFAAGTGGTVTTPASTPQTVGQVTGISIAATPSTGYTFNRWTSSSGGSFTSAVTTNSNTFKPTANTTITASFNETMTTITVNVSPTGTGTLTVGGAAFIPGNTTTAGVATSRTVVATAANDYTFDSWSVTGNATGTSSTNTYTLKGNGSGSTGTLTANFTALPCSLMYGNATPLNSPTSTAMTYDATEHAYYKDVTTNSSPYYFRFSHNDGKQWSGDWNKYPDVNAVSGDGTKVTCNTEVQGWENKGSLKYTGASGSPIRIWFDYQNKEAWITETTYSVTVAAGAGGSVSPTSVSGVGATTPSGDITATPDKGYVFTGWTLPSGTSAAAGYTSASNPIRINATAADKTITANFGAATAFIEGRFHVTNAARDGNWTNTFSSGNWDENSTRIKFTWDGTNNRYELHTYATPKELSDQISGYNPYFYVKESSSSSSLANVQSYWSSTSQTLTAAGTANKKSLVSSGTFHNDYLRFNSTDESGYVVLYFDETGVWYELEQTLTYHANYHAEGTGTAPTTTYHAKGATATAANKNTLAMSNYTFEGWNTEQYITGTGYAVGANITMNSNVDLYGVWKRNIPMENEDATTNVSTTVYGTYNCATLSAYDNPAKTGYVFDGWWTREAGGDNNVISPGHELLGSMTNWTTSGRYTRRPGSTSSLYAKWIQDITLNANTANHGSGSNKTAAVTYKKNALTSITHCTPAAGYELAGYYTAATGGTKILNANGTYAGTNVSDNEEAYIVGGVWKHAGATTLYAQYSEIMRTVAVTVNNAYLGTVSAASLTDVGPATASAEVTATPTPGATLTNWTLPSGVTAAATYSATSNPISVNATAAGMTITANFTETMHTVTLTNDNSTYGTVNTSSPLSVGQITAVQIQATPKSGYMFSKWVKTAGSGTVTYYTGAGNGQVTDASGEEKETTYICVTGNVTLQATWEADRSSGYVVHYGNSGKNADGGTDASQSRPWKDGKLYRATTAASDVSYFTFTAGVGDVDKTIYFKIWETSSSAWDHWYGYNSNDGGKITGNVNEATLSTSYGDARLCIIMPGSYRFTWNKSTKKLSVEYPNDVYYLRGGFNGWSWAHPMTETSSGVYSATVNMTEANHTYSGDNGFKVLIAGQYYGKNSTTFTRTSSTGSAAVSGCNISGANMGLTTDYTGDYTFTYNTDGDELRITYPTAYKVTYGKGSVDGSASDCSAVDITNGGTAVTSNSTWVKSGNQVVLTAPAAKSGYRYLGWYDNNSATGDAITTNANCTITVSSALTRYACYAENLSSITVSAGTGGTVTTGSGTHSLGVATTQAINASASNGYSWSTWTTTGNAALGTTATTASNTAKGNGTNGGSGTVVATFTPNDYDIILDVNGGSGDNQTVTATFAAAMPTVQKGGSTPIAARTKTGYNFDGYTKNNDGTGTKYYTAALASNANLDIYVDETHIYAKWDAKQSTLSFDYQTTATGYGTSGSVTAASKATYDAAMPSLSGTMPTAAQGYAFMGFYSATGGGGTKYYNADGTSANNWAEDTESTTTLYAYYKKAEITALAFDALNVDAGGTVGVTPTISPTPVGNTIICWTILHSNDTPLDPQPAMTYSEGKLTFAASAYSGTYKVQAVLRTGSSCDGGTELDTRTESFTVAGTHTVTVNYKCGDDVIKAATSETATPLDWSDDITAPDIFGYTFSRWDAADGVTIKNGALDPVTTSTNATIQIKATYNGNLTAVYTQKSMIYFKNTLGWSNVYVNFYTDSYWNNPKGSGNQSVTKRNLAMTRYGETDIWYYDYGAASITPSLYVSFTSESQDNTEFFWKAGGVNVVYPANYQDDIHTNKSSETGFKAATPMFVPLATQEKVTLNQSSGGKADYYNAGYWTKYLPGTGYRLEIYDNSTGAFIKAQDFTSADELMPMKAVVDLEGGTTYKFHLRRGGESSAGIYYGNTGTMTYSNHGQGTPWDMTNTMSPSFSMCKITTNAAGDYTFNLSYSGNSSTPPHYRLRMAVDYPVADGDYRLVYSDAVQTKPLTSAIVSKANNKKDTVSFFVRPSSSPQMKIQTATVNPSTGAVTWGSDVAIPTATLTDLTSTDVYNFNLSMNGSGNISLESVDAYTGNFYIRTDAANSKWDNYKSDPDHLMTYSEYSIEHGGYTHYYCHWVKSSETGRKNVKFVIANDYSPNISDTLARETASGTWANIGSFINASGDLLRDANVRFMWDKRSNTISRAYIDGAQNVGSDNFLYMLNIDTPNKIRWDGGSALTSNKVTFTDKGNWMYEANIEAQPTAQIRLLSNWGTSPIITQYFRGSSSTEETLVGGSGDNWYDIRVIYDFKTNRLIAGLVPSGTIDDQIAINADVMFIREHQGDIAQLTFAEKDEKMGAITNIETAYGVLQFNKWTINNKSKESGHSPLTGEDVLSRYERDLFYVSFPFRVAMEEVFGFGTYGQHWIIEEYDGASRAANGYWQESGPNWKFVTNRKGKYFEPGQGYIIALDLDELGESSSVWANTDRVELYFPSYGTMDNITSSTATYEIPSHLCTINRTVDASGNPTGLPADYDRRVKDSHWNVLGVPTYVNPLAPNFANTDWTTSASETSIGPNFLYQVNWTDNSVSPVSASGYTYHAMHAYLVQYWGDVTWTSSVSVAPSDIVARRMSAEKPQNVEFKMELSQNDKMVDQTFIKLSDDENVTTGFEFNYDLSKEFNANKANIYTLIAKEPVAGNVLPLSEQTTVVPVGVKAVANGDYTFSIPDGTEGIGIMLIDNETGIRTSLSALDYTVNLSAGTYENRFLLEISPVHQSPTAIELLNGENGENGVRKVLIDNILYIVKDGVMYDARGNRVQ